MTQTRKRYNKKGGNPEMFQYALQIKNKKPPIPIGGF